MRIDSILFDKLHQYFTRNFAYDIQQQVSPAHSIWYQSESTRFGSCNVVFSIMCLLTIVTEGLKTLVPYNKNVYCTLKVYQISEPFGSF